MNLDQAIDEYLQWLEIDKGSSQNTVEGYGGDLAFFAGYVNARIDVAELDRELLRNYQRYLGRLQVGPPHNRRTIAASYRARRLVALRQFLKFCAKEEWTTGDLGVLIDVPRLPERLPKPLDDHVREKILAYLDTEYDDLIDARDRALISFLLSTGCRISEATRLDRPEWNPRRQRIIGKGNRERIAEITPRAELAVNDYLALRRDKSAALFIGLSTAQDDTKRRLTTQGANYICHTFAVRVGIPPFHPHRLRHTLGTLLQEEEGDARLTADTLGHRGLASVSGYTKISDDRRKRAYVKLQQRGI